MKVYIDERVQFSVDGDPELGRHCGKGEYVYKVLFILKTSKGNILELWCGHSLGVHHLCMPWIIILRYRVGYFGQDSCF